MGQSTTRVQRHHKRAAPSHDDDDLSQVRKRVCGEEQELQNTLSLSADGSNSSLDGIDAHQHDDQDQPGDIQPQELGPALPQEEPQADVAAVNIRGGHDEEEHAAASADDPSNAANIAQHDDRQDQDSRPASRAAWVPPVTWRPHGRFRRVKNAPLLGEGAYSTVHRVLDMLGGSERAIKRQNYRKRPSSHLASEVGILSMLQPHVGIVELLDVCYSATTIDIVMPIYWGSLQDLLDTAQGRELRSSLAKNLTRQLLMAGAFMHKTGVVHLDIKPDNILLSDSGTLKIGDFGIAVEAGKENDVRTAGTLGYTAPECLMGSKRATFQNDVWSTGCVVAEMFLGRTLFSYSSAEESMRDILRFTGHNGGEVFPRANYPPPNNDVATSFGVYQADASVRLRELDSNAADIISAMLKLQPNRRPHLATFHQHPLFTEAPLPLLTVRLPEKTSE
ncbi:hypothetical protein CF319_g6725 [Tilletia indica]|nr:hypothetical protein CF319_g6725 [Tilletia indica]